MPPDASDFPGGIPALGVLLTLRGRRGNFGHLTLTADSSVSVCDQARKTVLPTDTLKYFGIPYMTLLNSPVYLRKGMKCKLFGVWNYPKVCEYRSIPLVYGNNITVYFFLCVFVRPLDR